MIIEKINPVLRDLWLAWLKDAEGELMEEEPNIEMLLRHVQMLIECLTPFSDISEVLKDLEALKGGNKNLANKCPYWKRDERLSGFPPTKDYPDSCLGCTSLKMEEYEGWYCKGKGTIEEVPYPDMEKIKISGTFKGLKEQKEDS